MALHQIGLRIQPSVTPITGGNGSSSLDSGIEPAGADCHGRARHRHHL